MTAGSVRGKCCSPQPSLAQTRTCPPWVDLVALPQTPQKRCSGASSRFRRRRREAPPPTGKRAVPPRGVRGRREPGGAPETPRVLRPATDRRRKPRRRPRCPVEPGIPCRPRAYRAYLGREGRERLRPREARCASTSRPEGRGCQDGPRLRRVFRDSSEGPRRDRARAH